MKFLNTKFLLTLLVTFLFGLSALAVPPNHGKGKRKNKGRTEHPNARKKEDRFVNGHDARDGRWDKRGPKSRR
ncbi:MAG TPA: hypothetical protein VFZ34_03480 [Blastocatellia bacterium]|nr:hypothetical protein [Blastocatellia bacterium]